MGKANTTPLGPPGDPSDRVLVKLLRQTEWTKTNQALPTTLTPCHLSSNMQAMRHTFCFFKTDNIKVQTENRVEM